MMTSPGVAVVLKSMRRRYWVAGLHWVPVEKNHSKERHSGLSGITRTRKERWVSRVTSGRKGEARFEGGAVVGALHRGRRLYSLSMRFSQQTANGYGVFTLEEGVQYLFLASQHGRPSVMGDIVGDIGQVQTATERFLQFNAPPSAGWQVISRAEDPLPWQTLVSRVSLRDYAGCALYRSQLQRWVKPVLVVCLLGLGGLFWHSMTDTEEPRDVLPTAEALEQRARALLSRETEPTLLPHPWASQPIPEAFLRRCQEARASVPVVLEGWRLTRGTCEAQGLTVTYGIAPGGTAAGFKARSEAVLRRTPVFDLTGGGREGHVTLLWAELPLRDESLSDAASQLLRLVSWFQARQQLFALTEISPPEPLPGEKAQPVQTWREYRFTLAGKRAPEALFAGIKDSGLRISKITFALSHSGLDYTTEGHLYAQK